MMILSQIFTNKALTRFGQSPSGIIGMVITILIVLLAILAPIIYPYNPAIDRNYLLRLHPPDLQHLFGTDGLGRDLLVLVWYGLRTSLTVSIISVTLGFSIGLLLGLIAGYYGGWLQIIISWISDILLAFPAILLAIAVVTITGPSLPSVIIAVGLVQIPIYIRLTQSMVLSLREQEFIEAVKAMGGTSIRIIFHHILPGSLGPLIVQATLSIGTTTLEAAGLGFLGLGAQPPNPELGTMLADAFKGGYSLTSPWTTIFPGLFITLMVLAFNLLGDGLRDSLDPRSTR